MKQLISVFAIMAIMFTACTSSTKKGQDQANSDMEMNQGNDDQDIGHEMDGYQHDHDMDSMMGDQDMDSNVTVQESQTASVVIDSYLEIKNALVEDDDRKAASAGNDLLNALNSIDAGSVDPDKITEFKDILADAKENADHISENKGNIEHQREHFEMLGTDIKDLITLTGSDRPLFLILCPMYNNNKGGIWLSASAEIRNPYYGSKMISCGEVKMKISVK